MTLVSDFSLFPRGAYKLTIYERLCRLGKDLFETLYRFIKQAWLVINGRSEKGEAQNR